MRPVNLLPPDLREGARAPMRTGPLPYIVVGALVAVLAGVALLITTGNQVSERKSEVAQLKREDAAATQEAKRLAAYTQFQALHEQRLTTIASLADSRFDWERVMRELSLVLPHDVWLTELSASASPESSSGEGGGNLRKAVPGPAMELQGCATGQDSVAGFVAALKDIDGVTRVGVESSELSDQEEGSGSSEGGSSSEPGGEECQTRKWIAKFSIVVAFDAAPIPITAEGEGEELATASAGTAETASSETESSESESSEGG
jgi:Tfp pilus assembly protein PilN